MRRKIVFFSFATITIFAITALQTMGQEKLAPPQLPPHERVRPTLPGPPNPPQEMPAELPAKTKPPPEKHPSTEVKSAPPEQPPEQPPPPAPPEVPPTKEDEEGKSE